MDSNTPTPKCGICELRHMSEQAEIWCTDCDEGLCISCKDHHSLSKASRSHKTIQVAEYLELSSFVLDIKQYCEIHEENFQMFCKIHNCPCCRKCIVETHNTCKEFAVLDDIIGTVKTSTSFVELEQTVNEITSNVRKILINRANNLTSLEEQKENTKSSIRDMKQQVIHHLEKLEKDLIKELHEKAEKEQRQIQEYIQLVNEKEKEILDCHNILEKMKQHASNLQCFLASKQIEVKVSAIEEFLYSDDKTEMLFERSLNVKYDGGMSDIESLIKRLGTIRVDVLPGQLDVRNKKHRQAQLSAHVIPTKSFDMLSVKLEKILSTCSECISGLTVIPEGLVFSSSCKKQVTCIDEQGAHVFAINTSKTPFDLVYIHNKQTIAVSSGRNFPYRITLVNIAKRKESDTTFSLPTFVYGMALKDTTLLCAVKQKGIYSIDINKVLNQPSKMLNGNIYTDNYMACFKDKVYYTNVKEDTVTCCKDSGEILWVFKEKQVLGDPAGIAVDLDGVVYVTGGKSSNVVAISQDGKTYKILLSKDNKLENPRAIHYNAATNELLIANRNHLIFRCSPQYF